MSGAITKRIGPRGTAYTTMVDLPPDPVTGKRRQKRITAQTKKEVETQRAQLLSSLASGGFGEADANKITVGEYLHRWLEALGQTVRFSTQERYSSVVKRHIIPAVGREKLAKVSPLDIQRMYNERLDSGLSPTTVALIHNVLHKALKQAVRWGLLTRNVTEAVDPPKEANMEYVTWNPDQVAAFLVVSDKDELAAFWRLALLTGMRRGEMLGLKWEDVDLKRKSVSIKRTLSRGPKGSYVFGMPKTAHGRRAIALPQSVVDSLQRHRKRQVEARLKQELQYQDRDLVFADVLGDSWHPNTITHRYKRLQLQAGVPIIRIHDLRHTSATLMLANGEHPKIVQERLGHADVSMTLNRYSHVTMDMQRDAADRLDKLLDGRDVS